MALGWGGGLSDELEGLGAATSQHRETREALGYGSQKAPRRLTLAPGIPARLALAELGWHWETQARFVCGCPHPGLDPPGAVGSPCTTSQPQSCIQARGVARNQGLALEVPAGLLGWGGPAPAPQLETGGEARAGKLTGKQACCPPPNCPCLGATALPRQLGGGSTGSCP